MRIMGIDPGTYRTGVGLIDKAGRDIRTIHYEVISVHAKLDLSKRLKEIFDSLNEIFKIYKPDVVALENIFFSKNFRSAVKIGEARAVAILAATNFNIRVVEYPPASVKLSVCGNGRAGKEQVQKTVKMLLGLKELPPPDAADALALCLCHTNVKSPVYV